MNIGERLKELRNTSKASQTDFASKYGKTRDAYKQYEYGVVKPDEAFIKLVCINEGVNEHWLETGEGEMFTPKKEYKDNLSGHIGQLVDDLIDGEGRHSEFKEWLLIKTLKMSDDQLDAIKELILDFTSDRDKIKNLDIKKDED